MAHLTVVELNVFLQSKRGRGDIQSACGVTSCWIDHSSDRP